MGEPNTITSPPRSWQAWASATRYSDVRRRTAGSGRGEVQSFGLREQPVQADDLDAARRGLTRKIAALRRRQVGDAIGEGERGDLEPVVADLADEPADPFERPALELLVARREAHTGHSIRADHVSGASSPAIVGSSSATVG